MWHPRDGIGSYTHYWFVCLIAHVRQKRQLFHPVAKDPLHRRSRMWSHVFTCFHMFSHVFRQKGLEWWDDQGSPWNDEMTEDLYEMMRWPRIFRKTAQAKCLLCWHYCGPSDVCVLAQLWTRLFIISYRIISYIIICQIMCFESFHIFKFSYIFKCFQTISVITQNVTHRNTS